MPDYHRQAASFHRPCIFQRQHRRLLERPRCNARSGSQFLDIQLTAPDDQQYRAGSRIQRLGRRALAVGNSESESGAYCFVQQSGLAIRHCERAQALRPLPQYSTVSTGPQNGDKSGHSSYHALLLKGNSRFSRSLTGQWSYAFSKLLTDSDTYFANSATAAMDQYNRGLEKSIGQFDRTHTLKFATIYNLPFGPGQRWATRGFMSQVIGGWRLAGIQVYNSSAPLGLTRNNPLQIFNGITRPQVVGYDNWRIPIKGDRFDPAVDNHFKAKAEFGVQPIGFGNATRYNPKIRGFWGKNERVRYPKHSCFMKALSWISGVRHSISSTGWCSAILYLTWMRSILGR